MVCPGPVTSPILEKAFGKSVNEPLKNKKHPADMKRVSAERCAYLTAVSIANKLDETWISLHPILALFYFTQYLPSWCRYFMSLFVSQKRLEELRDGGVQTLSE